MSTSGTPDWVSFYCSEDVVRSYSRGHTLQAPEQAILDHLGPALLARSRVLDLGVGGGRTTPELVRRCASYVGADFAAPMVEACRQRFGDLLQRGNVAFDVADARALPFASASFDLLVFSFNGIDLVGGGAQRLQALSECRRVLRPGGAAGLFLAQPELARQSARHPLGRPAGLPRDTALLDPDALAQPRALPGDLARHRPGRPLWRWADQLSAAGGDAAPERGHGLDAGARLRG